jgi:TolB protein
VRRAAVLALLLLVAGCGGSSAPRQATLVFVSTRDGDYAIFGVDAGGREWRLTKEKGDPSSVEGLFFQGQPAWSPDGASIAFVSRRDRRSHVYVMRADGTHTSRLTSGAADDSRPAWSPDGRRIAFSRDGQLWLVPAHGGNAHRLTHAPGGTDDDPVWSPSGKLIAYDYRPAGYSIRELWIVDADGGNPRPVTRLHAVSSEPTWSPDGKRLAFQSNLRGGHDEIYSIGVDGNGLRRETSSDIDTIDPAWSPAGGRIAFSRDGAIWTVDPHGTLKQVTAGNNDSAPAWRP